MKPSNIEIFVELKARTPEQIATSKALQNALGKLGPVATGYGIGAAITAMPVFAHELDRLVGFEKTIAAIQAITRTNSEDMDRLRQALLAEVNIEWISDPGSWAVHEALQGKTVEELIAKAKGTKE